MIPKAGRTVNQNVSGGSRIRYFWDPFLLLDDATPFCYNSFLRRGVEQWQLVGLITRRSEVRILPPLLDEKELSTDNVEEFLSVLRFDSRGKFKDFGIE